MGLLTNPNAGQGKIIKILIRFHAKLCFLMYIAGVAWFCCLAHTYVSLQTHFSENALLPGLVKSEFGSEKLSKQYYDELLHEMTTYKDSIPYPWLLAKFQQMGLDTYTHNFTLNYPLGKSQKFTGKNVYGILRAARGASTESVVLSVPYRPPSSVHLTTAPSIAVMLAFAKYSNREIYWAKDIIFLITEHEQLGIQAWLEAYHSSSCGREGVLESGDLRGRAGSIQAAINLEIHDVNIGRVDVKIEGLNGHLPNLDLVTLTNRMCLNADLHVTFKNRPNLHTVNQYRNWKHAFETMLSMISTQSTGVPNGNHGLFHRFGIEAVTLEGFAKAGRGNVAGFYTIGKIIEALYRSLNNLLERFHQSYFFYLLPSTDRFISIGLYIPVLILLAGSLLLRACAQWYKLYADNFGYLDEDDDLVEKKDIIEEKLQSNDEIIAEDKSDENNLEEKDETDKENIEDDIDTLTLVPNSDFTKVGMYFIVSHIIGVVVMESPVLLSKFGLQYFGYGTEFSIFYGFCAISLILIILPLFFSFNNKNDSILLNILIKLELGTILIGVGMMNFSLALVCCVLYVPVLLIVAPTENRLWANIQRLIWLIYSPFLVILIIVIASTSLTFPNEDLKEIYVRGIAASKQAVVFSIVDSIVYGNWLYNLITVVFIPCWLCIWFVLCTPCKNNETDDVSVIKKEN